MHVVLFFVAGPGYSTPRQLIVSSELQVQSIHSTLTHVITETNAKCTNANHYYWQSLL